MYMYFFTAIGRWYAQHKNYEDAKKKFSLMAYVDPGCEPEISRRLREKYEEEDLPVSIHWDVHSFAMCYAT